MGVAGVNFCAVLCAWLCLLVWLFWLVVPDAVLGVGQLYYFSRRWRVETLYCALVLELGVVACELKADADVVLHAAHLSAEGDAVSLEGVCA